MPFGSRADLLALTPEALALLSNMGLLKRAQKEIAAGHGPSVGEEEDGTVIGVFGDGVASTLPPGKALKDGTCSCGASSVCRHRLATVLVYIEQAGSQDKATPEDHPKGSESPDVSKATAQQAGELPAPPSDRTESLEPEQELKEYLGRRLYDKAVKLRPQTRARVESEGLVHLDTCSVRFLSGRRLEFARCDCRAAGPCEHLALALWALRGSSSPTATAPELSLTALDNALALVEQVIEHGVSHLGQGLGTRFDEVRRELLRSRMVWPHDLLEEVESELGYYQNRGGRYRTARLARCLCSLWARRQASGHDRELALRALGLNQVPETSLRQLRLTGLGCRLEKDETQYYLADAASGTVLVLQLATGHRLRGLTPAGLAGGQVVSADAHRRANGLLRLGRGPHSLSGCGSWEHLSRLHGPPPLEEPLLGECHAAPSIRILPVDSLRDAFYSPGQQELSLVIESAGLLIRVALAHRSATPFALECLWSARQGLRAVAGVMEREGRGWVMRPTALLGEQGVVVPDLASEGTLEGVPLGQRTPADDPLAGALESALSCWHDTLHRGLGQLAPDRLTGAAGALRRVGLERTATHLESARSAGDWLRLATRLESATTLLHELNRDC